MFHGIFMALAEADAHKKTTRYKVEQAARWLGFLVFLGYFIVCNSLRASYVDVYQSNYKTLHKCELGFDAGHVPGLVFKCDNGMWSPVEIKWLARANYEGHYWWLFENRP